MLCYSLNNRCHQSRCTRSAFTLIELLVVISIIMLLMAILLPALQKARNQARAAICQTKLKQWGATLALYTQDSQGRLPTDVFGHCGIWLLRGVFLSGDDPNADGSTLHHFGTKDIAFCPMAVRTSRGRSGFGADGGTWNGLPSPWVRGSSGSTFLAWEITSPAPPFRGSYGFNSWVFCGLSRHPPRRRGRLIELDLFSLRGRAQFPTILDDAFMWSKPLAYKNPPRRERQGIFGMGGFCINRHNGHVNSLFLDWSVRRVGLKELWTLKWDDQSDTTGPWTKAGGVLPEDWPYWMRRCKDY